jgi:hypothetical protein
MSAIIKFQEEYVNHLPGNEFALRHDGTEFSIWVGNNYARLQRPEHMEQIADKLREAAAALRKARASLPKERTAKLTAKIRPYNHGRYEMALLLDGEVIDDGFWSYSIADLIDAARAHGVEPEVVE